MRHEKLTALADAIRAGIDAGYKMSLDDMASAIEEHTNELIGLVDRSATFFHIPYTVTSIGSCAFRNLKFETVYIPSKVTTIASDAFMDCTNLRQVKFYGTPTSISSTAFDGCNNVTFDVPWTEGAVANAPWGATSATVNYEA